MDNKDLEHDYDQLDKILSSIKNEPINFQRIERKIDIYKQHTTSTFSYGRPMAISFALSMLVAFTGIHIHIQQSEYTALKTLESKRSKILGDYEYMDGLMVAFIDQ
ncbi:MAG: hypothetical protein ACRCTQ_04535 [Brevinemataceae bacterium]